MAKAPQQQHYNANESFNIGGRSQSDSSSSRQKRLDTTTGQDTAHTVAQKLQDLEAQELNMLVNDPIAAIGASDRMAGLRRYLHAYRNGYQLPDQEVIPQTRIGSITESLTSAGSNSLNPAYHKSQTFNRTGEVVNGGSAPGATQPAPPIERPEEKKPKLLKPEEIIGQALLMKSKE